MANILVFFQEKPDYAAALEKKGHKVFYFTEQSSRPGLRLAARIGPGPGG